MSQENQSPPEQPLAEKKLKKGTLLMDRAPSILKTNRDLDRRGILAGKLNLYLSIFLLINAIWATVTIMRAIPPSTVYVQYYSEAGILTPIKSVSKAALPPPHARKIDQTRRLDLPFTGMDAVLATLRPLPGEAPPETGN